jgi:hypothetical protein
MGLLRYQATTEILISRASAKALQDASNLIDIQRFGKDHPYTALATKGLVITWV